MVFTSRSSIFVSRFATVSLSNIRQTVDVWVSLFRFSWKFKIFLSFSVATSLLVLLSISASFCHTSENSTLRPDQVSLFSSNLVDELLWVSPDFSSHLDFAQSQNLSQHARPSSTIVWFCPILSSPFIFLHPFRHRSRAAGRAEILRAAREQQIELNWLMFNKWIRWFHSSRVRLPLSKRLRFGVWCQCNGFEFLGPN